MVFVVTEYMSIHFSDEESSDGDYFEIDPVTGEIRLKAGKAKIDIKKLTDADLRRLGIDPTLPKSEIKRLLMVRSFVCHNTLQPLD
jgi:hypothetical protein